MQIIGHAIVSVDGKIAAADGSVPPALRNGVDWQRFQEQLDAADLVVLGRQGHERFSNPGRRRLVATRSVPTLMQDPQDRKATFWNPAGVSFNAATASLGLSQGTIAVAGVFDLFCDLFTRFGLAESQALLIRDGLPCFTSGHPRLVLANAGLTPGNWEMLDPEGPVTLTDWRRL